ncbi:hypothetical protein [Nocardioides iriomotensis]|uniref:Uncharacterized protein n=1 Tax=Nocardioides iriomotensis TaxID=715784 RepID=A0A4Q5JAN0_9ACTN|nr:hypothetical protein [Nocardioides iriomotensis]RYU14815.1 hypothetical protein ETU37_02165 [Nocardioides iriomotensis]
MTTSQFDDDSPDREVLASFVYRVCDDLNTVTWMRGPLFAPDRSDRDQVIPAMGEAWEEVRTLVPDLIEAVRSPRPGDGRLPDAGLVGGQLRFSVAAWRESRTGLLLAFEEGYDVGALTASPMPNPLPGVAHAVVLDPALPPRRPRWMKWALKRLSQTLGHADTLLESLASVINLAEPVKEYRRPWKSSPTIELTHSLGRLRPVRSHYLGTSSLAAD